MHPLAGQGTTDEMIGDIHHNREGRRENDKRNSGHHSVATIEGQIDQRLLLLVDNTEPHMCGTRL